MLPLMPSFNPKFIIEVFKGEDPHPHSLPFVVEDKVFVYSTTNDKEFMDDPLKRRAWMSNKITGPDLWWLGGIRVGWHTGVEEVQRLCNKNAPDSVLTLYHPVTQFRLAMGTLNSLVLENAKEDWKFFWAKKSGALVKMN